MADSLTTAGDLGQLLRSYPGPLLRLPQYDADLSCPNPTFGGVPQVSISWRVALSYSF